MGLKKFEATKFEEKVTWMKLDETKFTWLLKAFEHQTHHRGQTTIYLRTAGVHPPNEKLF
ncbi:DinB family protein, partial [Acinetobacter baumannii]